jgi:hypothetical protein
MRIQRNYMGTAFEVWTAQQTWYWHLVKSSKDGAMIGAAATEAVAVREACLAIEEMSPREQTSAATDSAVLKTAPMLQRSYQSNSIVALSWERSLANLARYLTGVRDAGASR